MSAQPEPFRIAGERDALQRARNAMTYVSDLAASLDNLPETEQHFARVDGRQAHVAGQQRVHVQLASASALIAIAEALQQIADALGSSKPGSVP
jgi:hypothetical protein